MGKAKPFTRDELDRLTELHGQGMSCRQIATELGRGASAVSRHARDLGLTFDTARTAQATERRVIDSRAKRAILEGRFLDEAGALLDQLHKPHLVYNFGGKDNTYEEHQLDEPDVSAKRALIQAAGTAVDKAIKLAETDKAASEADAGKSMVGALFAAFRATAPDETPEADE